MSLLPALSMGHLTSLSFVGCSLELVALILGKLIPWRILVPVSVMLSAFFVLLVSSRFGHSFGEALPVLFAALMISFQSSKGHQNEVDELGRSSLIEPVGDKSHK